MSDEARIAEDARARERITRDLDLNMLVEAGAGSGKTTSLVDRMIALVARGTPVERIAAVTFTRKAANELRERFQLELERRVRTHRNEAELSLRYDRALRESSRAFLGTIHSFCGRLLREQPFEAGLDPQFTEVSEDDWQALQQSFWRRWIERARHNDDPGLIALREVGIDVRVLFDGFERMVSYADVDFPIVETAAPDIRAARDGLISLIDRTNAAMPDSEPEKGWDDLMKLVRRLQFYAALDDWKDVARFCSRLERISLGQCKATQYKWGDDSDKRAAAKALAQEWCDFVDVDAANVLEQWREHRYPIVMRFLSNAVAEFARERHATGQLGFEDLLLLSARLLRNNPRVRTELGARYAHLLVDEFQDTDPVQAEVCFLLASSPAEGNDWRRVVPRPGSLFVVGDPKQSIYRFRRADIQTYELVKQRLAECGVTLALTRNFRSVKPVEDLVNAHFARTFPENASDVQAQFTPMETSRDAAAHDGIYRYLVPDGNKAQLFEDDAALVASWIAARIERGERRPASFLVLTPTTHSVAYYARALAERNVPVATKGAALPQEYELRELLVLLRALADPEEGIAVTAALEGLFVGASPADLFEAHEAGVRFVITHPPAGDSLVARGLRAMYAWWRLSQRQPSDVLLERIFDETGLLVHAAGQSLGDARAGALLHLVETLRSSRSGFGAGIVDAIDRIQLLLGAEAADAPLRPGRTDAVLVMNVHQAKGLEADVVMLAAPLDAYVFEPNVHIERREDGLATGALMISAKDGWNWRVIAHPPEWTAMQAEEQRFIDAEKERLLYVAVTRARHELIVAQRAKKITNNARKKVAAAEGEGEKTGDGSLWSSLADTLEAGAQAIALVETPAPGRRETTRTAAAVRQGIADSNERRGIASASTMHVETVTESAKAARESERTYDLPVGGLGAAWGRAVHRGIDAMARGRSGERLQDYLAAIAKDEDLPNELALALARLPSQLNASSAWKGLNSTGRVQSELGIMRVRIENGADFVTEGIIDALARGANAAAIVDWKTDSVDDSEWRERERAYSRQVSEYGAIIEQLTGLSAQVSIERVLPDHPQPSR
jgi:ATP-dependent helicase/nuclease subunit A